MKNPNTGINYPDDDPKRFNETIIKDGEGEYRGIKYHYQLDIVRTESYEYGNLLDIEVECSLREACTSQEADKGDSVEDVMYDFVTEVQSQITQLDVDSVIVELDDYDWDKKLVIK